MMYTHVLNKGGPEGEKLSRPVLRDPGCHPLLAVFDPKGPHLDRQQLWLSIALQKAQLLDKERLDYGCINFVS
jgi:hypothetical protein